MSGAGSAASSAVSIATSIWGMVDSIKAARAWEDAQAEQRRALAETVGDQRNALINAAGTAAHQYYGDEPTTDLTGMFARTGPLFPPQGSGLGEKVLDYAVPAVAVLGLIGLYVYLRVSK